MEQNMLRRRVDISKSILYMEDCKVMVKIDKLMFHLRMIAQDVEKYGPDVPEAAFRDYFAKIKKGAEEVVSQSYISTDDIVSSIAQPAFEALQLTKQTPWTRSLLIMIVTELD